jgi:polyisoprenoid-binding protein YceI
MPRYLLTLLAALALGAGGSAAADQQTLTLDPSETTISFTLGATLHTVHGSAPLARGVVAFDPDGGAASGEIVVDAELADTGNEKRDREMHEKVLLSPRFPSVALRPTRTEGRVPSAGTATITVHGSIDLIGRSHEIAVPVEITVSGSAVALRAEFELPYVDWGMKDPGKFLLAVDKHVTVTVVGAGTLSASGPEPSAENQPQP